MDHPTNLTLFNGTYDELTSVVGSANGLVVAVFGAQWCPPCKRYADFLPQIAMEFAKVTFLQINTDEAVEVVQHYGIFSIPHTKFLKAGQGNQIQELAAITGFDISQIRAKIQQYGN
ncbi:Thioredoxin family protein [Trichomonas vaginalis G3]|uniref:Thioredoxin family protein n=1 Tax=Trichomonas vaginalis (strain ATCC PRA-98 / G3) TaxID=412133 RepID=A2FWW5_TRIV3|nr:cell redox homeostasis [Trichomonas vaginalis G3]EAX90594.1 Thioredoxin family protein [Trichomonas vaginalis G3]KAI5544685.1 cell redox homeostasis [Trichomonas vaginalis G3]|eukprot:XP_001303524.1 Thioredoxin family protein [Trichomonas vaginalis G3]